MQAKKMLGRKESCIFLGPSDIKSIAGGPLQQCNKTAACNDIFCEQQEGGKFQRGCWLQGQDWQTIVAECGPLVWRTAYRLLANHADAADCFQETFLAALELSRREPVRNMAGLSGPAGDDPGDRPPAPEGSPRALPTQGRDCDETGSSGPADEVQAQELVGQLREAIGQLPAQEAKVFCLRYLSEMSYRQIARAIEHRDQRRRRIVVPRQSQAPRGLGRGADGQRRGEP